MDHAAKIHGRGQSPWGIPTLLTVPKLTRNVADSANYQRCWEVRNLKETEKGKHLQTALSQGHKMSQNVLRCFKPSNCSHQVTSWRWARTTSRRHSGHAEWEPQTNENFQWRTWRKAEGPLKGCWGCWGQDPLQEEWLKLMAALWSSEASVDNGPQNHLK